MLDTTIGRLRQITTVIARRSNAEERVRRLYIEWQTKALASYVAAIAPHPKQAKALLKQVEDLNMLGRDRPSHEPPKEDKKLWTPDMPSETKPNEVGSFERIMSGMGT